MPDDRETCQLGNWDIFTWQVERDGVLLVAGNVVHAAGVAVDIGAQHVVVRTRSLELQCRKNRRQVGSDCGDANRSATGLPRGD